MNKELHCWDLELGVLEINKELALEINKRIVKKFSGIYKAAEYYSKYLNKSQGHLVNILSWICNSKAKKYKYNNKIQQTAIPIKILLEVAKDLKISKEKVEKGLICIRNSHSSIEICNPKFPFKINPIFSSLLFHYYCDGSHENWSQSIEKHPLNRKRYFQKIEKSIGQIKNWNSKKHNEIYTPIIIYNILEKIFNIKKDNLTNIKFPKGFLELDKEILMGALISIISDEGHICKDHYEIRISQKNKNSIEFFHKICQKLQYETSPIIKEKSKIYTIKLKWNGLFKFYYNLLDLNKKYNNILDLGDKQYTFERKIKFMENKLKNESLKQPKGYSTNLNKKDVEILRYFNVPNSKRKIHKLTGLSLNVLHHIKGKLKNLGLVEVIGWKNKESILKITKRGAVILNNQ